MGSSFVSHQSEVARWPEWLSAQHELASIGKDGAWTDWMRKARDDDPQTNQTIAGLIFAAHWDLDAGYSY